MENDPENQQETVNINQFSPQTNNQLPQEIKSEPTINDYPPDRSMYSISDQLTPMHNEAYAENVTSVFGEKVNKSEKGQFFRNVTLLLLIVSVLMIFLAQKWGDSLNVIGVTGVLALILSVPLAIVYIILGRKNKSKTYLIFLLIYILLIFAISGFTIFTFLKVKNDNATINSLRNEIENRSTSLQEQASALGPIYSEDGLSVHKNDLTMTIDKRLGSIGTKVNVTISGAITDFLGYDCTKSDASCYITFKNDPGSALKEDSSSYIVIKPNQISDNSFKTTLTIPEYIYGNGQNFKNSPGIGMISFFAAYYEQSASLSLKFIVTD